MKRSATCQAIDIWMGTCTAFVFFALVEFTFVNYTWRTRGRLAALQQLLATESSSKHGSSSSEQRSLVKLELVGSSTYSKVFMFEEECSKVGLRLLDAWKYVFICLL